MPTENFENASAFRLPADYYSTPPVAFFPRWVPFGCGGVSLFALLVIFVLGIFFAGEGFPILLDFALVSSTDEIKAMYADDVTPREKVAFEEEMKTLRTNIKTGKVPVVRVQPILQTILLVGEDKQADKNEIATLTKLASKANGSDR
ncbi:MAG TPA: hypothetical protein VMU84_09405 [Thermoanaerobaculia bacterium]|nr:hypothetical protein [Thermoanaerobaculia bacterium]